MKKFLTVLFGLLVIAVVTPIAQLCTISMSNHDLETSSVSGWVYGGLFVMVLIGMIWRSISKRKSVAREQVVILFTMFALAVPMMNLGLARQFYTNLISIPQHFIGYGVDSYSRAYEVQEPDWFPVVPVDRDLALLKAEKIFEFLRDDTALWVQRKIQNDLWLNMQGVSRHLGKQLEVAEGVEEDLRGQLSQLPVQVAERIASLVQRDPVLKEWMAAEGLETLLDSVIEAGLSDSRAARREIETSLPELEEEAFYFMPVVRSEKIDRSALKRVGIWESRLSETEAAELRKTAEGLKGNRYTELQQLAMRLHPMDLQSVIEQRRDLYLEAWQGMRAEEMSAKRTAFIYRLGKQERKALMSREGGNLAGLLDGVYLENADQARVASRGVYANIAETFRRIPAAIWRGPLARWGALFVSYAGLMLYMAWLLRERWVDRENLAFPLVEIADNFIRHDYLMESADDVCAPTARNRRFSPVFWVGFLVGALMIFADAASYYSNGSGASLATNVSQTFFTSGVLSSFVQVVFVLSPIILGIFFLLNLEMSFSVWAGYFLFRIVFWSIDQGSNIRDANYVGFSGQSFPFWVEQLLGAGLCFALVLLGKSLLDMIKQHRQGRKTGEKRGGSIREYILHAAGLAGFLLVIYGLCYDLGLRSPLLFSLFTGVSLLLAIAVARMRAETGMPLYHSTYDFTRLPMVLGLSRQVDLRSMLSYFSLAFLPFTMLFRLLPQQIENFELGRRHHLSPRLLAVSGLLAVLTAIGVGLVSLLVMSYWLGDVALGQGGKTPFPNAFAVANYSSWVSHFKGENGLESFTVLHSTRLIFVGVGAAVFGGLMICRQRFLKFPLHPMGYLLLLFGFYFPYISPYGKGGTGVSLNDVSWLWGSALCAWLLKRLIIKYGGIQAYRKAKPAAVGLIFGAAVTLLVINLIDLSRSYGDDSANPSSNDSLFKDKPAYSPEVY